MIELWKPVIGYEGLYEVSTLGRIFSVKRQKLLTPCTSYEDRHSIIVLHKDGKQKCYGVHRLVALAFLPNPERLPIVNHIDGDKRNNSVDNLEWCTQKENVAHALRMGLREKARIRLEERHNATIRREIESRKSIDRHEPAENVRQDAHIKAHD